MRLLSSYRSHPFFSSNIGEVERRYVYKRLWVSTINYHLNYIDRKVCRYLLCPFHNLVFTQFNYENRKYSIRHHHHSIGFSQNFPITFIFQTIVLVAMIGVSIAAHVPTLQRAEIHDQHGQFALNYATADGVSVAQQGALKTSPDGETRVLVVQVNWCFVHITWLSLTHHNCGI